MIKLAHMRITNSNSQPGLCSIRSAMLGPRGRGLRGPQHAVTNAGFKAGDDVAVMSIFDLQRMLTLFENSYGKTVAQRDLIEELREALTSIAASQT